MAGIDFVQTYLYDLLGLMTVDWDDHLEKIEVVLSRLKDEGLKINAKKSFFGRAALEYLGYWVTRHGIMPMPKKVKAIQDIAPPKNKRELRKFIGLINYYRDMWIRRSDVLAPLNALTSTQAKWQWTEKE